MMGQAILHIIADTCYFGDFYTITLADKLMLAAKSAGFDKKSDRGTGLRLCIILNIP